MSRARSLLVRLRKLEVGGQHAILKRFGSVERLEKIMLNLPPEIDPHIGPFFMACVRSWIDGTDHEHNGKPFPEEFHV